MHPVRQRKLLFILSLLAGLTLITALIMYALRQNISLFYTPSQMAEGKVTQGQKVRIGGMVVKGSIVRGSQDLTVRFKLTDFKKEIEVSYRGILPDLFREGQGIVALGQVLDEGHFNAAEVLAKHDANYMPPEVKAALAAQGKK
ncbi:cytochrome c maturation protein CcmE [Legionella sp. MW5194]|uniref:cytochrome c maturation protein CcmE n=1 Tax=Legionella sp. MW5194 TaxID=2662448 RepID=UPI00193E4137|nr:cytochrome c maturation protein CcmE [Legionella sp. MW5194]QRN05096.1 cytochrome c maturation protein CcmE [Legionella sp. MW5194]